MRSCQCRGGWAYGHGLEETSGNNLNLLYPSIDATEICGHCSEMGRYQANKLGDK